MDRVIEAIPVRIQRSRQHKQVSPNGLPVVYVGRGSKWGSPFRLVKHGGVWTIKTDGSGRCISILTKHGQFSYDTKEEAAKNAVNMYQTWLLPFTHKGSSMEAFFQSMAMLESIEELRDKNLSCWCKVGEACHADLLLELANR